MILSDVSIKRPVFMTMVLAAISLFGVLLYSKLSVDMLPDINYPVVTVSVVYPGASPETMESQVADPIEAALNGLAGIHDQRSTSFEGMTQVVVQFDLDKDAGKATEEVREKLATIQGSLPADAQAPTVQKLDLGAAPILTLALKGEDPVALSAFADNELKAQLERLKGVGQVDVAGSRKREMHVYVNPEQLRSYALTAPDVAAALRTQNVDLPSGSFQAGSRDLVMTTTGAAKTVDQLKAIPVKSQLGTSIRIRDVAEVVDGFEDVKSIATVNGTPAVLVTVQKQSGSNTVDVAEAVRGALPALRKSTPEGVELLVLSDNSTSIKSSIDTVQLDLVLGAFLAVCIIFLFLRDWRATLISGLALPVSVLGTFAFVQVMGFTLNMMTTLALSLSIGILIDDAIVVIENIVRRRTVFKESPHEAAARGTAEIGLAVFATTLSIVAVFVPVATMEGILGQFFFQFGMTVAFAVLMSLFVSFTLTPMLSSRFLTEHEHKDTGVSAAIGRALGKLDSGYRRVIRWCLGHRAMTMGAALLSLGAAGGMATVVPFEFMPVEDTGEFPISVELSPGATLKETEARANTIAEKLRSVPGVESTRTSIGSSGRSNMGDITVTLIDKEKRSFTQLEAMSAVRKVLANEPNIDLVVGGSASAVQLELRGSDPAKLAVVSEEVLESIKKIPGLVEVRSNYRPGKPEIRVQVDRMRAGDLGVSSNQIASTMRTMFAGEPATKFESRGERYDVRVQLPAEYRETRDSRTPIQVRTGTGELVGLDAVAQIKMGSSPTQISRVNRQRTITLSANVEGISAADATAAVQKAVEGMELGGVTPVFGGDQASLDESLTSMVTALLIAILCIFAVLASQFESFLHPFTIMASLPFALIGAFGGLIVAGMAISIYGMIGLIMLMGLVTKNAILLVDFAIQLRGEGEDTFTALENAGATRLQPILMTTAAMVFGMLPVAIGHGEGGEARAPMGVMVIGGLLTSTVLTLVVVPVIYSLVDGLAMRFSGKKVEPIPPSEAVHAQ